MDSILENIYRDILDMDTSQPFSGPVFGGINSFIRDDDTEDFMTSKEIVQQKKEEEKKDKPRGRGGEPGEIEEDVHFHRYTTRREHKYTETEMEEIRESCITTIVHDYGENDVYHQSDEERAKNDLLNEIRDKLQLLKRTYRKPDQYVEAMRTVMKAWDILEKSNFLHTREEFFQMVADGRIYSNSIIMPKLKKMDSFNFDMLVKYISNPDADVSALIPKDQAPEDDWYVFNDPRYDEFYNYFLEHIDELYLSQLSEEGKQELDEMEERERNRHYEEKADEYARDKIDEEEVYRLLSPHEAEFMAQYVDNPPEIEVHDIPVKYIRGYDQRSFGRKKKKGSKRDRYIAKNLHVLLNKIQTNYGRRSYNGYDPSALIVNSMFEPEDQFKDFWDKIRFDGSWANDDEVFLYDLAIREELLKQHPVGQRYLTFADQQLDMFFRTLEEAGVNTIDLRRNMNILSDKGVSDTLSDAAKRKENKKMEAAIIDRVTKLNKSPKFKKLVAKAEKKVNEDLEDD